MSKTTFKNRVFGITMVKSVVSNYNADFTKQPRTLPSGTVYATDKALKYTIKHFIKKYYERIEVVENKEVVERKHNRIMYFRNFDNKMQPRTLGETYVKMFGTLPKSDLLNKDDEYFLFYINSGEIKGLIPAVPKKENALNAAFWKKLKDEESDNYQFKSKIESVFSHKGENNKKITHKVKKLKEISDYESVKALINNDEGNEDLMFFIFPNNDDNAEIIEFENQDQANSFLDFAKQVDNMATGGIDKYALLKNLLKCIDVRLFGSTFADQTNISIHGPVQITHGLDRTGKNSELRFSEQIMSPFRSSNEKSLDKEATTLGTQFQLEEGHYVHQFSINPSNLDTHNHNLHDDDKIFIDEADIEILKKGLKKGVTDYDSASKIGSENELFLWIELKENSKLVLPNMQFLIDVDLEKKNGKSIIDLSKLFNLLESLPKKKNKGDNGQEIGDEVSQIGKIELGYNVAVTELKGIPEDKKVQGVVITETSLY